MTMKKIFKLIAIYSTLLIAIIAVLSISVFSGEEITGFKGAIENSPKWSFLLAMLSVLPPLAMILPTCDFFEKESTGKAIASFLILMVGELLFLSAVSIALPAIEFAADDNGWVAKATSAAYGTFLAAATIYALARIAIDGIFGDEGFLEKAASVIAALPLLYPAFALGWFVLTELWWIALIIAGLIMVIGYLTNGGGSSATRESSGNKANDFAEAFAFINIYKGDDGCKYVETIAVHPLDKCWKYLDTSYVHTVYIKEKGYKCKCYRLKE